MATAKKLPSGTWRILVYSHKDETGKKVYKSFTARSKQDCEMLAARYAMERKQTAKKNYKFAAGLESYISSRRHVLSPATVREYTRMLRTDFGEFGELFMDDMTAEAVQEFITEYAHTHSPKTTRNVHALIASVLKIHRPYLKLNTKLPERVHYEYHIPTIADIRLLIETARGTDMEYLIMLAAYGSMRRGEVCALHYEDIKGNAVHVHRSMYDGGKGKLLEKQPKTYTSDRYIVMPDFVIKKIGSGTGRITSMTPHAVTKAFAKLCKTAGLPRYRFHDLRHFCASEMHAIGIPDAYIMQRGGWHSDYVLKNVYRHALKDSEVEFTKQINEHFMLT